MNAFKIKDSKTGKFSTGGASPNWTKNGKVWGSISHLKSHLRQFTKNGMIAASGHSPKWINGWWNNIPDSWVVVELSEEGVSEYSAAEIYPKTTGENKR